MRKVQGVGKYASMPRMNFPTLLAQRMRALNLTQADLADRIGIDQSAVSKWKAGRQSPRHDEYQSIADALDVPLDTVSQAVGRTQLIKAPKMSEQLKLVTSERDSLLRENERLRAEVQKLRRRLPGVR